MTHKIVLIFTLIFTLLFVAACGTEATPVPSSLEMTEIAEHGAEEEEHGDEEGEAAEATAEADASEEDGEEVATVPTETPLPPTPTEEPPTATPTTVPPTEIPTEAPTEEPAAAAESQIAQLVNLTGDPVRGEELYTTTYQETSGGPYACSTCHSIEPDMRLIGPSLWGINERAGERVEGEDWATYIYNSITMPNAYIVEGEPPYPENLMPGNYSELLSDQEIYHIIAYMMTLHDE